MYVVGPVKFTVKDKTKILILVEEGIGLLFMKTCGGLLRWRIKVI